MLTGESIQVLKTPIPNNSNLYNLEDSAPHILFAGTRIVQVNSDLKALVTNTGFLTSKGSLIRSIMYPPPMDYAFDRDCTKFCVLMFLIGVGCAIHIAIKKSERGIPLGDLVIKTLDSITILLPAALPATLTIGKLYALKNLKKKDIFCTNSKVLTCCGSIDVVCLDKTGTITEDNLDFIGVVPKGQKTIQGQDFEEVVERGMAVCHNLATYEGTLQGDHLEVQMFKAAGGKILEGDQQVSLKNGHILKLLERYQFSSNLRRMSVIVQNGSSPDYEIFCKGSPEIIKPLCKNSSEISDEDLQSLTKQGYRVISLATRKFSGIPQSHLETLTREEIETDLEYLGYLVFENKLKPGSKNIIQELKHGNLAIKMITGDNIETAISVAKECGIIPEHESVKVLTSLPSTASSESLKTMLKSVDHLAVTGTVWSQLMTIMAKDEGLLKSTLPKIQVFARMASNQKQQVVEQFQGLGMNVCMCGDGANDCSALKTANVGISLTESESSMAAHLTSRVQNISAVLDIVREGRSALVTTITMVKIILTTNIVQYIGLLLLYELDASFADLQFLYLDLHMLIYGFFIGYVDAYSGPLSPKAPTKSLVSLKPNLSIIGQLIPTLSFQFLILWMLRSQNWFKPYQHDTEVGNDFMSYENYVVFTLGLFQYTSMAVIYSRGKPYRKPMWTNVTLMTCIVIYLCIDLIITLGDIQWLNGLFELMVPLDTEFRWMIIGIATAHFITSLIIEEVFIEGLISRFILDRGQTCQNVKQITEA
ncbi:probable cation-transporting ATPase 13A4 [Atheta coriaria]|uniref:probable cation-transporting ATPase 13A4 n=1 Tax=Dalotia coriaria TaxID=877792 RepID=UPI0031F43987